MADDITDLALRIKALEARVGARNATQLDSSTIDVGDDDSLPVADAAATAVDTATNLVPDLQERLDANSDRLQENAEAVQAAMEAADAAEAAGLAAGEEASQAADEALEKAQDALDAAAKISNDVYTGRAPTTSDPGVPGQGWYVWDSNYHIQTYYVYQDDTVKWVQTVLDDGAFGNIDAGSITTGYLGAQRIAAASLTAAMLAADTLTSREIGADAILARNIKAAEITGAKIAAATITGGNIAANTITAGNIKAGTITANEIAAGTITATSLAAGAIDGKTITGAFVRSAASGSRVELVQNGAGGITAYSQGALQFVYVPTGTAAPSYSVLRPGPAPADGSVVLDVGTLSGTTFTYDRLLAVNAASATPNDPYFNADGSLQAFRAATSHSLYLADTSGPASSLKVSKAVVGSITHPTTGRVMLGDTGWQTAAVSNATQDSTNPVQYRIWNGMVVFRGLLTLTSSSIGATIFQLPVGFRPSQAFQQTLLRSGGTGASWVVRVQAGGNVALPVTTSAGGSGSLEFGGLTPFVADN